MTDQNYDVIIVGAGIAGLTAAYELKKRSPNAKLLVLEAKNRVGGRTSTINMKTANGMDQWDIGGQWVGRTQRHLLDLLKELNIEIYPQYTTGKKLARIGSDKIRYYTGSLPIKDLLTFQYGILEMLDFARFMHIMESMSKELDPILFFNHPKAKQWDSVTVEHFARSITWTRTVRDAIDAMCFVAMGIHSNRISLLYLLVYGRRAGSVTDFLEATGNGAQGFRIKGGSQQICDILREAVGDGSVLLEHPVEKVIYGQSMAEVITKNNKQFRAKKIIMAIPSQQAGHICFNPPLPESKRQLLASFPMANLIKFVVTYSDTFWRRNGFSGEIVARGDSVDDNPLTRPILCTFDATTSHGSPAILGFLSLAWCNKSETERRDAVIVDLARYLGQDACQYVDYVDKNWSEEPYTGGCPVGIIPPGMMHHYETSCSSIIGAIHWAGTETASEWCGYMSGAVQSGLRAAHEVLFDIEPSSVRTEHIKNTMLDPDFRKIKQLGQNNKRFSGFNSWPTLILFGGGLVACFYFVKKSNFQSPIKFKFISSF